MMKNPPHPGELLRDSFGEDGLNISLAEAARRLGVSRASLSRVVHGKASLTADLAVRLELANLSRARLWLGMQSAYDLSQALKGKRPRVTPLQAPVQTAA